MNGLFHSDISSKGDAKANEDLAQRVRIALQAQPVQVISGLDVRANGTIVTLSGKVRSFYDRQLLITNAIKVDGVDQVVDELAVESTDEEPLIHDTGLANRTWEENTGNFIAIDPGGHEHAIFVFTHFHDELSPDGETVIPIRGRYRLVTVDGQDVMRVEGKSNQFYIVNDPDYLLTAENPPDVITGM